MTGVPSAGPKPVLVFGVDPSGIIGPVQSLPADSDDEPTSTVGLVTLAFAYGYNVAEGGWDRLQVQPIDSDAIATTAEGANSLAFLYGYNGATWDRVPLLPSSSDAVADTAEGLSANSKLYGFNGATWDRVRVADVFKTVVATAAGSSVVWTPAAGKRFRLMGYTISISGTTAATVTQALELLDGATVIANHLATVTETTPTGDTQIGVDFGQGLLSSAANNVLEIHLGTAMGTGGVAINAWGTEE